jgi:hypothetical protein
MIDLTDGIQTINFPDTFKWKDNTVMPTINAQNLYIFKCVYLYTDPIAYTGELVTSVVNTDYEYGIWYFKYSLGEYIPLEGVNQGELTYSGYENTTNANVQTNNFKVTVGKNAVIDYFYLESNGYGWNEEDEYGNWIDIPTNDPYLVVNGGKINYLGAHTVNDGTNYRVKH